MLAPHTIRATVIALVDLLAVDHFDVCFVHQLSDVSLLTRHPTRCVISACASCRKVSSHQNDDRWLFAATYHVSRWYCPIKVAIDYTSRSTVIVSLHTVCFKDTSCFYKR